LGVSPSASVAVKGNDAPPAANVPDSCDPWSAAWHGRAVEPMWIVPAYPLAPADKSMDDGCPFMSPW
jgi:hypothetical protein